jgi:SAM-dependent methyltransferase
MIAEVRGVAVLAFADELEADPQLLSAWNQTFDGDEDITLAVYAEGWADEEVFARVGSALAEAGIDDDPGSPDVLALPGFLGDSGERALADRCGAVFSRNAPRPPFDHLRRVDEQALSELRDLLPARFLQSSDDALARVSPQLRDFVNACPNERRTILEFMLQVSEELEPGARVLDVGAGEQPYRELFGHVEYVTTDWANSVHPGARRADIVAPADNLPIPDCSFEAAISTQVLEHVAEPANVLRELHRVLVPGGRLYITLPLAWELHEEPFDFYRYTRYGISHLLRASGFTEIDARPRNDCFTTIAQLMRNTHGAMGSAPDGLDGKRAEAARAMYQMAELVDSFAYLDTRWSLPLGYAVRARRGE